MATWYVNSAAGVLEYSNRGWTVGDKMVPALADATANHLVAKQWVWECTTGGPTTVTPTWPATVTDDVTTITSEGVVWIARAPDNWNHAMPGLYWLGANSTTRRMAIGDIIYVGPAHNKDYSAQCIIEFPSSLSAPVRVVCAGDLNNPPTSYAATAWERMTANNLFQINGTLVWQGLNIEGRGYTYISSNAFSHFGLFQNCTFTHSGTSTNRNWIFGTNSTTNNSQFYYKNCTFSRSTTATTGTATQWFHDHRFENCTFSSNNSVTFFGSGRNLEFIGCDFSGVLTSSYIIGAVINQHAKFVNCKFPAFSGTGPVVTTQQQSSSVTIYSCDASSEQYRNYFYSKLEGKVSTEAGVYLPGGAAFKDRYGDPVPYSFAITNNLFNFYQYTSTPWISKYLETSGAKTISMDVYYSNPTTLFDLQVWLEIDYYDQYGLNTSKIEVSCPTFPGTTLRNTVGASTELVEASKTWVGMTSNPHTHVLSKTITVGRPGYIRVRVCSATDVAIYVDPTVTVT